MRLVGGSDPKLLPNCEPLSCQPDRHGFYWQDEVPHQKNDQSVMQVSTAGTTQPVTYTWENIEVETDVVQGNCFNRRKKPTIRKRILDKGMESGRIW